MRVRFHFFIGGDFVTCCCPLATSPCNSAQERSGDFSFLASKISEGHYSYSSTTAYYIDFAGSGAALIVPSLYYLITTQSDPHISQWKRIG